jgi:subtilase family serine protease
MPRALLTIALLLAATNCGGADLIVDSVDSAHLSALLRNRMLWATPANDRGGLPDDLLLSHLTLVLKRSPDNQIAFEDFLKRQQDPNSPDFHRWLTPEEFGSEFGASLHDIETLTAWLQSRGLHIDSVPNGRTRINFSGTAANVGSAFVSQLHVYEVDGELRIAPTGTPQIPAALSTIVQAVHGLATIHGRPYHREEVAQLSSRPTAMIHPYGTNCSGGACIHYVFPADFAAIYDVNPVYELGIDGRGQTIAITGRARVYVPDIENFQRLSALAVKDPVMIVPPGAIDPGAALSSGGSPSADQAEATLDVSRASSVAPGATILLVVSANSPTVDGLGLASQYIVDTSPAPAQIMSISFGDCEANGGPSAVAFWDSLFSQAAAQGISVFAASGDGGAAGCDHHGTTPPSSQIASPSFVCASSHATCVGGTQFADTLNPAAYWSSTNGAGLISALGYIPEGAWNEPLTAQGKPTIAASGGGVSGFISTPSWQTGLGVPGTGRHTPDMSLSASAHTGYVTCLAAAGGSCVPDGTGILHFMSASGTSAAAPGMAGIAALLNQKMGSAQGNLNPRLYALAGTAGDGVFHDATVGTSGVSGCTPSVPSMCNNSTPGPAGLNGGLVGYLVAPGYDEVTGLGSIDVAALLTHWTPSTSASSADVFGSIKNNQGIPLCAMVLANGQYMFSCAPFGSYSLHVPLDPSGQITLFGYADGHFPFKAILPGTGGRYDMVLKVAPP